MLAFRRASQREADPDPEPEHASPQLASGQNTVRLFLRPSASLGQLRRTEPASLGKLRRWEVRRSGKPRRLSASLLRR